VPEETDQQPLISSNPISIDYTTALALFLASGLRILLVACFTGQALLPPAFRCCEPWQAKVDLAKVKRLAS